jgi:5-(carboxyamino)imidazole ribonucleotide mutase
MPAGIPVATVAVNGSENAALLAVHILAMRYPHLADRLKEYRRSMVERVHQQDSKLQEEIL